MTNHSFTDVVFTAALAAGENNRFYTIVFGGAHEQSMRLTVHPCPLGRGNDFENGYDDECTPCRNDSSSCGVGHYLDSTSCSHNSNALCRSCNNLPTNAIYNTSGAVNSPETCDFACVHDFWRTSSDVCEACDKTRCPEGFYRTDCLLGSNAPSECVPCSAAPANARLTFTPMETYNSDTCDFICLEGAFDPGPSLSGLKAYGRNGASPSISRTPPAVSRILQGRTVVRTVQR